MSGDRLQRDRGIFDRPRKRADLIQTRGEGHEPKARDAPVGRLQADDAAESGWLADRSSGIGTEADRGETGGNRRGGPAAAPSGNAIGLPRIAHRFEGGVFVRRAHRELVRVGLPEKHRALLAKAPHDGGVVRRAKSLENARSGGGRCVDRAEHVLERDGNSGERGRVARGQPPIGSSGLSEGGVTHDVQVDAKLTVKLLDALQVGLGQFDRRDFARIERSPRFRGGEVRESAG